MQIIWVIDDHERQLFVESYFRRQNTDIDVHYFRSGESLFKHFDEVLGADALFLNLKGKTMSNLDVARQLRRIDTKLPLFFIGSLQNDKFLKDIEQFPDIVLEPLNDEKIDTVITFLKEIQLRHMKPWILARSYGKNVRFYVDNIYAVEAMGHEIKVMTEYRHVVIQDSLTHFVSTLDERFILSHRSYAVNVAKIKSFSRDEILLVNGDSIPMSRRQHAKIMQGIIEHSKYGQTAIH